MDKRSLLFIILISLSFFVVNLYFTQGEMERQQQFQVEEKAKKERLAKEKASDIAQRTAPLDDLHLVEVYGDDSASHLLTFGWKFKDSLLVIPHIDPLPTQIYARDLDTTKAFAPYSLELEDTEGGFTPAIYKSSSAPSELDNLPIPLLGQYDLQVATFTGDPDHPVQIKLGSIDDGAYTTLSSDRIRSGIAFLKGKNGFLPVGFVEDDNLLPLKEFTHLLPALAKGNGKELTMGKEAAERFYILENDTIQLVFSEVGGSLVEINLPFESKKNPNSVVKEVDADRRMLEIDPKNALFPYHPALQSDGHAASQQLGGFYPLLRRDLIEPTGKISLKIAPENYALAVVSAYPELANLKYKVVSHTPTEITLEGEQEMRKIRKTFRLSKDAGALPYLFELDLKIEGDTKGLWLTTGVPEAEWVAGSPAPALKYRITKNGSGVVEDASLPTDAVSVTSVQPNWISNSNGFFGIILDPQTETANGYRAVRLPGAAAPSRLVALVEEFPKWNLQDLPGYMMLIPLKPTGNISKFRVFSGPLSTPILKRMDAELKEGVTGDSPEFVLSQSVHGWFTFISEPFSKFLFWIMSGAHFVTGSWAFSIFIVTVVLRILLWPLTAWSTRSTVAMQKVSPLIAQIQEKYKKDPKVMQMKMMEVYKENKINPLSGCLPLLIQMPFLIGMFDLLKSTYALRGASFIPGWIDDLSAPDVLFSWDFSIPLIGSEFHLLPILLGLVMWLQAKLSSTAPSDPTKMTDQQRQQRTMMTFMSILFTVMFYSFPSGLNLYWLSSMLLGILQQFWTSGKLPWSKAAKLLR